MIEPSKLWYMRTTKEIQYDTCHWIFTIPEWFEYDGASIPRVFWIIGCPFEPLTTNAVIIHDYLYNNNILPKQYRDDIFYLQLVQDGATTRAKIYYIAVRIYQTIKTMFKLKKQ